MKTNFLRGALLISVFTLGACSSGPATQPQDYSDTIYSAERILPPDIAERDAVDVYDPWEGMNKRIYNFNYHFDRNIFLPVARGYKFIMPDVAQTGVTNFFNNIRDMLSFMNSVLQLSPDKSAQSLGRVMVNSTVGILGLFDVASAMDIPRPREDFGQTMGRWGVGTGPYLVIPFLGPSNLRDGIGFLPDFYVKGLIQDEIFGKDGSIAASLVDATSTRANVSFRYYETGSAFEYDTLRWLYSTKRELDVAK
jgi:phospholipid-binding lipoprotein MlaA